MINLKQAKILIILFCTGALLYGCDTMGQIGDSFTFHTSADTLERALDTLFAKYPEYKVPKAWEQYETIKTRPTNYTENKYFFIKSDTPEMYCVVFVDNLKMMGDSSRAGLAIRAVNQGNSKWMLEQDLDYKDERKIAKRFDKEIIAKLQQYTGAKVRREE